jgi:flagellar hook assembly protein FlgD
MLEIWPPRFIDNALIAGERTQGSGRLLATGPGPDAGPHFVPIVLPEFDGVDLWDVAWRPSGRAALIVGGTDAEGVAFLLRPPVASPDAPIADWIATEVYRAPGGPLKGAAFSPDGNVALMVGGQKEVGPAVLARILRFDTGTGAVSDLSGQASAAGIEFRDVVFRPITRPEPLGGSAIPVLPPVAILAGGNTAANAAVAIAYTALAEGGEFSPLFTRPGPAINGLAFDRSGQVLMGACDQPAAGGNAPIIVASPGGVVAVNSGAAKSLRAVSIRQVGEMVAWPMRPLPTILLPLPETDKFLEALSVGLKSSLVEGSRVYGVTVAARVEAAAGVSGAAQAPGIPVGVWVVLDLNRNGIRDPEEPVLGRAVGTTNAPIVVPFTQLLPVPPAADAAFVIGADPISLDVIPPTGIRLALAGVMAIGAESERVLFVRGLPVVSPPILPRLIAALGAWPNPFSPNGDGVKDTTDVVFALLRPATCTIKLFNRDGAVVRTLLDHVASPAGRNAVPWNGKNDAGTVVPDGVYAIRLWAIDAGGVKESATALVIVDTRGPVVSDVAAVPPVFSPNGDGRADFTRILFRLNETSWISVRVYQSGAPKGEIFSGVRPAGPNQVIWDGRIGGRVVPDGRYQVGIFPKDMGGNPGTPAWTVVVVDTVRPVVRNLMAVPPTFSPNGDGVADVTVISYGLSERSLFFLVVVGQGLRITLVPGQWQNAGLHTVIWDGLIEGNPVPNGTYRVAALAIDAAMNPSFIATTEVTVANPGPAP